MRGVVGQRYFIRPDVEHRACADGVATIAGTADEQARCADGIERGDRNAGGKRIDAGNCGTWLAGDGDFRRADVDRSPPPPRTRRKFVNGIQLEPAAVVSRDNNPRPGGGLPRGKEVGVYA